MTLRADDLDALVDSLRDRDYRSLPFALVARDGVVVTAGLVAAVNDAIDAANRASIPREPLDPSWCTSADPIGGRLVAEIAKGCLNDAGVRAWLVGLDRELADRGLEVQITVHVEDPRVLEDEDWHTLQPTPTAFLHFTDSSRSRTERSIDVATIRATAAPIVAWTHIPGATLVVEKGLRERVVPPADAVDVLLEGMPLELPQFGVRQVTQDPLQLKLARFEFDAEAVLQVLGSQALSTQVEELLAGLRIFAEHIDYASVRRAMVMVPSKYDVSMVLDRRMTRMEELVACGIAAHLLPDYVPDAYVAQVLTDSHLAKAGALSMFDVEELGRGRHLVRARDVQPWISGVNPDPAVLDAARREFGEMLLTEEVYRADLRREPLADELCGGGSRLSEPCRRSASSGPGRRP